MKDVILPRLNKVKGGGGKYRAKCPAREHSSGDSTLSILFNSDGRILIHCHGGCEASDVLEAIGLSLSDLYPDGAIRDFMASAAPKRRTTKDDYVLMIGDESRKQGKKLSPTDLKAEREAYLRRRAS